VLIWAMLFLTVAMTVCVLPTRSDPERSREAAHRHNQAVIAVHEAIRDYSRCLHASLARDDCGAEFIELQATHREFETAITEPQAKCGVRQ
jgi:hypothetical protein